MAKAGMMDTERIALAAFVQGGIHVRSRCTKRRQQADNETCEQCGGGGKCEDAQIESSIHVERETLQMNRAGQTAGPHSENYSSGAAENCEQDTLREHLANESHPSCAQRSSNSHFALARRAAREQDVFHVHASEQQDEGGQKQEQAGNRDEEIIGIGDGTRRFFRNDTDGEPFVRRGILAGEARGDYVEGTLRFAQADSGSEAPEGQNSAAIAVVPKQARGFFLSHRAHGEIDVRFKDGVQALESLRRDPDDGGGFSIDEDLCSDGARIAVESFLPVAVAENYEERFAGRFGLAG